MRRSVLASLTLIACLAFGSSASATFTRVSDTGSVGYETNICIGPNCYYGFIGSGSVNLQAPSDEVDYSYLGGSLHLRTWFEPQRIHTEFDGGRFDMSQPPCDGCTWDYLHGAGNVHGERFTIFTVSDPTPVRLFGNVMPQDMLALDGPGGTILLIYDGRFDETLLLDPGQYSLNLLMPSVYGSALDFAGGERVTLEIVPEPGTLSLLAIGLAGLGVAGRSRRHASAARCRRFTNQ